MSALASQSKSVVHARSAQTARIEAGIARCGAGYSDDTRKVPTIATGADLKEGVTCKRCLTLIAKGC